MFAELCFNGGVPNPALRDFQGALNPCCRRERPVSWTGLDDGDVRRHFLIGGPCAARTRDSLLKRQILYQLS